MIIFHYTATLPQKINVSGDLLWFNLSPCSRDVEVYPQVCLYTLKSLLGMVTVAKEYTSEVK